MGSRQSGHSGGAGASRCPPSLLLGIRKCHLDRIRMKLPRTSVESLERSRRSLYRLLSAFRIADANSPLQTFEWMPIRAEESLEEAHIVCRHHSIAHLAICPRELPSRSVLTFKGSSDRAEGSLTETSVRRKCRRVCSKSRAKAALLSAGVIDLDP